MRARHTTGRIYSCPLVKTHVQVQLKKNRHAVGREPEVCSSIGECGCGVVEIIYGMSYTVDWKKCRLYSTIKEQAGRLAH